MSTISLTEATAITSADGLTAQFMEVDPGLAATWLSLRNTHNRAINDRRVDKYARDMIAGLWRSDGMPLRFEGDFETLLDGQHRLKAQVKVDVTLTYLIATGLERAAQDTMDGQGTRSFADALHLRGVKNSRGVAAVVRGVDNYARFGSAVATSYPRQPSIPELMARFDAHPEAADAYSSYGITGLSSGMTSVMRYLTALADPEDSEVFMGLLRSGDGLQVGDPIHALRDRLAREAANRTQALPSTHRWVFMVRAWNAWRAGERLTKLQFKAGGARPDRVPLIDGITPEQVS